MILRRVVGLVVAGASVVVASASSTAFAQSPPADAPPAASPPAPPPEAPAAPAAPPAGAPAPPPSPPPGLPSELAPRPPPAAEKAREKEEGEGSRLSELFWINGEVGPSYVNMRQFSAENLAIQQSDGGGVVAGIGAGVRIVVVSLGFKLRWHKLSPFNLVQANGELLFKLPISKVDVLIGAHGGYSGVGSLGDLFSNNPKASAELASNVSVKGWNAGLDLGFDYFLNNTFSLGLGITGDFLFLQRPKSGLPAGFEELPPEVQAEYTNSDVYKYDGKSIGFGVAGALRVGIHLGP